MSTIHAAAVLLLREAHDPEALFVLRAPPLPFLGGQWAFPGGGAHDIDADIAFRLGLPNEDSLRVTALRELFEETGILLGELAPGIDPAPLRASPAAFLRAFLDQQLRLSPHLLASAGRYHTPSYSPMRIEARYFMAWMPHSASLGPLSREATLAAFLRPKDALASWKRAERFLPIPVRVALGFLLRRSPSPHAPEDYLRAVSELAEQSRALDPVDCGDMRGLLTPIVPGVHLVPLRTPTLPPATHTNCTLFGSGEVVAVDPASPYPEEKSTLDRALDKLAARGVKLRAVLLTHHHHDHIGGAAHLKATRGVPVWAHAQTAARVPAGLVDRLLEDGDIIELAGDPPRRLRALFTPGHAPGHLCFLEEHSGIAAVGDMLASQGTILIDPSEGDMAEYLASLARLKREAPRMMIPAHGLTIGDVAGKIDEYTAHRLAREAKVLAALRGAARAARPADLVPTAYADTPAHLYGLAARSLEAHLHKLVKDGAARALPGGEFLAL
jgi:glyoxylase-like metal-dependent hydrolase (beta-lactamase superfamily II)/8-oxo-dGTP pyrophosphatase MutT (NUDIX family)